MTETARLVIAVDSRQVGQGETDLARLGKTSSAVEREVKSLTGALAGLAAPLAAAFSVKSIYDSAEAYSTLTNRLRLVTDGAVALAAAQQSVFTIAQNARQPLEATAELYQRIATNQTALKLSGQGVADIVSTISKTLAISGASAESSRAALVQLGQAFASGTLRGEELNSVMEQAPALSQAIAAGMGKTVGQLRSLGAEGKLTAEEVVKALQKQAGAVDALFGKMTATVGGGLTTIGNSFTNYVGQIDQATGASGKLANEILSVSKAIDGSLPGTLSTLKENASALVQVLETGLYVAAGRVASVFIKQAGAAGVAAVANQALLKSEAESARQALATAQARQADSKSLVERAALDVKAAETRVASDRAMQVSQIANLKNVQAALSAELALEQQRLKAQITDQGRAASVARMAEVRLAEIAIIKQVEVAERSLSATTIATSAQAATAYAGRTAAVLAFGETTATVNSLAAASSKATAAASLTGQALTGLKTAGAGLLGIMGGPVGLAVIAGAVALSFVDFSSRSKTLMGDLGDLGKSVDQVRTEFNKLNQDQQKAELNTWKDKQLGAALAVEEAYKDLKESIRSAMVDLPNPDMVDLAKIAEQTRAYDQVVEKLNAARDAGQALGPILREAIASGQIPPAQIKSLEAQAGHFADNASTAGQVKTRVEELTAALKSDTAATQANNVAKAGFTDAGEKYLGTLQKQLGKLQDNNDAVKEASRYLEEHKDLSEADRAAILSTSYAIKAQDDANKAALKSTRDSNSEAKKHATEVENAAKKLREFSAQSDISASSMAAMSDAYLGGADNVRELGIQQKIEQETLKLGAGAHDAVAAAVRREADEKDRLDVNQSIASMRVENTNTLALATATLQGASALETFNIQKSMSIALSGKKIDIGSKEYEQLLEQTKAQLDANKALEQASKVEGIIDRLNPQIKLLKDYTAERDALNAAMIRDSDNVALYQDALAKLGQEYEVNQSKATIWGQLTEGAIDRIDGVFADAWANIGSGADSLWDNLVKGAKQAFGEIAHMLTTKPLLASISNWLTGTDNGQGLGSVWSKLLGSAGGSGGGGGLSSMFGGGSDSNGWGGMVSLGKNLYSAWSNLTGVGSSIASGYASGGVGGAISGGVGYYGNLLSSLGTTLSGGFSSIVGAITGSTATQVAANAATSAALQGAVAQGAAQVGTSIGIGGAAQVGASAAASAGTAAAAGAGAGFYASLAAMASNPVGWVIAAVTSAYQSGKLYDQGVRWNTKDVMNTDLVKYSGGIGQATLAPLALTNNVLEKVVGGKMAAIFSGSTFASAIITKVSEKIFGGSWATKDGGLSLGIEGGDFLGRQYIDQKKKGGLFGKDKKRTRYSALDPQMQEALQANYYDTQYSVLDLFTRLNVSLNDGVMDGLNVAATKISTKGKTGEEIQEAITKWFGGVADSMVSAVDLATKSGLGGYNFEALTTFVNNLYSVNDAFTMLGLKLYDVSVSTGFMAEQLVAMAGGAEAFNAANSKFFDSFYTDVEKTNYTLATVTKQFKAMDVALPGSRTAFRSVVDALDLTTESGRKMYVTLTGLAESASQAYTILEQQLTNAVTNAQSAVQRAISAQQKKATEAYNATNTSLSDMVSTVTENVNGLNSVSTSLSTALKALRGDSDDAVKMLRAQAQATLQSALATARSGKSLSGFTGLEDALDTVSNNNTDLYGSMEDFARDQGRTANVVAELNAINGKQLTSAEASLAGLKTQIDLAKAAYDAQMAQYDQALEFAQAQMDALNGVDTSIMGVTAAINAMNAAVVAALQGQATGAGKANTSGNNATLVETLYQSVLGRGSEAAGASYWGAKLQSGEVTYEQAAATIAKEALALDASKYAGTVSQAQIAASKAAAKAYLDSHKTPAFATGGLISGPGTGTSDSILARLSNGEYVMNAESVRMFGTGLLDQMNAGMIPAFAAGGGIGEVGPQLEVTGPSRIYNANQAASMLKGGGDMGALVSELKQMREENKSQRFQIAKTSQQVASMLQKWDAEGTPKERDYAL